MLELSHHSITEYRLPSTGELVPLLQIAPSKTDTERLLSFSELDHEAGCPPALVRKADRQSAGLSC